MAIEKKEIEYAKEIDDVMVLVVKTVKTIKEKGDYAALIPELIAAVNGADQMDDEFKANQMVAIKTVNLRAYDIAEIFTKKETV